MVWSWRKSAERGLKDDKDAESAPHFHVFMVRCRDGSLFTGLAHDPQRTLDQINTGRGPQYASRLRPVFLVYSEELMNERDARRRLEEIRRLGRAGKEELLSVTSLAALE